MPVMTPIQAPLGGGGAGLAAPQAQLEVPSSPATSVDGAAGAPAADAHAGHAAIGTQAGGAGAAVAGADAGHAAHAGGRKPASHGKHGKHKHGKGGDHHMTAVKRTTPENRSLARRNLSAVREFAKDLKRSDVEFRQGTTHGKLSPEQQARFRKRYPGLPVPGSIVFAKGGGTVPIGAVYADKDAPPNLGLGKSHKHGPNSRYMQHIWFVKGNLDLAFNDQSMDAKKRATRDVARAS